VEDITSLLQSVTMVQISEVGAIHTVFTVKE